MAPDFEDQGQLGRGGTSIVRRAYDPVLERHTAVKILTPRDGDDTEIARRRFLAEAQITGQLDHPHVVPVYGFGHDAEARDYIDMKLVEGHTLADRIRDLGPDRLEPEAMTENLEILLKVCNAVAYAHDRKVVHRDLKPTNIMLGTFGQVYVMDWGIALKEGTVVPPTEARRVLGTPTYIPPEQIDAPDEVDARSDVYCLGGCLYAILTGRAPHQGRTPMLRIMASMQGRIAAPAAVVEDARLPIPLTRIAMRALRRHPADRYPSVAEFQDAIYGFLRGSWRLPTRRLAAGEIAVQEGDPGHEAFVIKSGTLQVRSVAHGDIRRLGPGDVFGELAILSGGSRTSTVVAVTEVELLIVTQDRLTEGLGLNSWMGIFVKAVAGRFAELEERGIPPSTG